MKPVLVTTIVGLLCFAAAAFISFTPAPIYYLAFPFLLIGWVCLILVIYRRTSGV